MEGQKVPVPLCLVDNALVMFYHIRIDYFDKKLKVNQTLYEYDYSTKEDVLEKIVKPYLEEKRIVFSGAILNAEDRRQISVYETDNDIKTMILVANQNMTPGVIYVYNDENLVCDSDYSKDITKEMVHAALESVDVIKAAKEDQTGKNDKKQPLLFISHSTADEEIVTGLVEMLRTIGFNKNNLFCSSFPGYDIPEGEDIYDYLQAKLLDYKLFVIFVLSDSYYNSAACLNEMGAAWVLKANYSTIILPGFQIPDIKGAVNPRKMAVVMEDDKRVRSKLNQLKDRLIEFFGLPETEDDTIWENDRNKFVNIAKA